MNFIKLTHTDLANNKEYIYINPKDIITFQNTPEGTYMRLSHNNNIIVKETIKQIIDIIKSNKEL